MLTVRVFLFVLYLSISGFYIEPLQAEDKEIETTTSYLDQLKSRYEKLLENPNEMPKEAYEWLRQDIQNINSWDYQIVSAPLDNDQDMAKKLNQLGAERWELVAALPVKDNIKFILKKSRKSYLKSLPVEGLFPKEVDDN